MSDKGGIENKKNETICPDCARRLSDADIENRDRYRASWYKDAIDKVVELRDQIAKLDEIGKHHAEVDEKMSILENLEKEIARHLELERELNDVIEDREVYLSGMTRSGMKASSSYLNQMDERIEQLYDRLYSRKPIWIITRSSDKRKHE